MLALFAIFELESGLSLMLTRLSIEYEGLRVFWYDLLGLEAILGEHSISKTVISKFRL